jgi:hypothetical protein
MRSTSGARSPWATAVTLPGCSAIMLAIASAVAELRSMVERKVRLTVRRPAACCWRRLSCRSARVTAASVPKLASRRREVIATTRVPNLISLRAIRTGSYTRITAFAIVKVKANKLQPSSFALESFGGRVLRSAKREAGWSISPCGLHLSSRPTPLAGHKAPPPFA